MYLTTLPADDIPLATLDPGDQPHRPEYAGHRKWGYSATWGSRDSRPVAVVLVPSIIPSGLFQQSLYRLFPSQRLSA
jgi:hypothetical protein